MMYAQRDENGSLTGLWSHPVEGVAEEPIADDDPEVVAFREAMAALFQQPPAN